MIYTLMVKYDLTTNNQVFISKGLTAEIISFRVIKKSL